MKIFLLLLGLVGQAQAGGIVQGGYQPASASISESSVTITSLPPSAIVYTTGGGLLVANSTFAYTPTGRLGIGTASPAFGFHASSMAIYIDGANGYIDASAGTNISSKFNQIISSGASPQLDIQPSVNQQGKIQLRDGSTSASGRNWAIANTDLAVGDFSIQVSTAKGQTSTVVRVLNMTGNGLGVNVGGNGSSGLQANVGFQVGLSSLVVMTAGNVGIGTTNPGQLLDVAGTVSVGAPGALGTIVSTSAAQGLLFSGGATFDVAKGAGLSLYGTSNGDVGRAYYDAGNVSGGDHIFRTAASAVRMRIYNAGTVEVSSAPLIVDGTAAYVRTSSAVFVGTFVSTQTAGAAGVSVTALCQTNTVAAGTAFAQGGGCSCAGGVALTGTITIPNCATTGCIPTGWTCQDAGGTGGACSAYAICSRLQ